MKSQQTGCVLAVVGGVIVAALGIAALVAGALFLRDRAEAPSAPTPSAVTAPNQRPAAPTWPGLPPPGRADDAATNYLRDAAGVPLKFQEKMGAPPRFLQLALYPTYVIAEIQDPRKKDNVDQFTLRDGHVGDGKPVRLMGPSDANLEANLFDLAGVDFGAVPRMAADAMTQLAIEDGKVTHMMLRRWLPFTQEVLWRVYVSGPRKDGSVEYDPAGRLKKVWK